MKFSVSDLLFPGFSKYNLKDLKEEYGIEFFYEFGKDYYWNSEISSWGKRSLSVHGPCVSINLADSSQKNYTRIFEKTFLYAKKIGAEFVVVHTNEAWTGDKELVQNRVIYRLRQLIKMSESYGVQIAIENVGLKPKNSLLFDFEEYLNLFEVFPQARALLDTGHAHVNGWQLEKVIKALGERLIACHLHDNDGQGDAHLPIGKGNITWQEYFEAIKNYAPNAVQVLEYCCGYNNVTALEQHIENLKKFYQLP